jgi:predicted small secreted protein
MTKQSVVILLMLTFLSACNTVAGAGQDAGAAGRAVTHEAEKAGASR